ncbi:hypothetical protein F5Y05DRAFT_382837 [Hypoxylon sp. FL0543]|nr:hypothetical protein F5Y05DRAFT_382837 [Hypoxylon sp. FL0543]
MGSVLSDKDVNAPVQTQDAAATGKDGVKDGKPAGAQALEYHRQVLQSKMAEEKYGTNAVTKNNTTSLPRSDATPPRATFPKSRLNANVGAATGRQQHYISPSDDIMSPCTAKLNAFKGRIAGRAKPKSLFAQTSAKKFDGENVFGAKNTSSKDDGPQSGK